MAFKYHERKLGVSSSEGPFFTLSRLTAGAQNPIYVYDLDDVLRRAKLYQQGFKDSAHLHYALKANSHPVILRALGQAGVGADVVSLGELNLAVQAGIAPAKIVFSGVAKTKAEITRALELDIKQINVESLPELERVAEVARAHQRRVRVSLRINPDIDVKTHPYITTGMRENKFGIDTSQIPDFVDLIRKHHDHLQFFGLAYHIGSQILDLAPMMAAAKKAKDLLVYLRQEHWPLQTLDIGGGLGIRYDSDDVAEDESRIAEYTSQVAHLMADLPCDLHCEPGRALVARSGVLLGEVQYVKQTPHRTFTILNTGMNHLLRPALYQAYHRILTLDEDRERPLITTDVVGPICESADVIGAERSLPHMKSGDWLAIMDCGAYGYSMASTYNAHPLPEQIVISKGHQVT